MIRADVLLEHHDNVTHIDFLRPDLPPPGSGLEEGSPLQPPSPRAAAAGPLPARLNPRAGLTTSPSWRRFRRSRFVADLRAERFTLICCFSVVVLAAVVALATRGHHWDGWQWVPDNTVNAVYTAPGGTR